MSSAQNRSPLGFSTFQNVIAGNLRGSERIHRGVNPSDRVPLWEVPIASVEDLNEAVKASQNAFKSWSKTAWEERQKCLVLLRDELLKNKLEMCKLVMLEAGKPVRALLRDSCPAQDSRDRHVLTIICAESICRS